MSLFPIPYTQAPGNSSFTQSSRHKVRLRHDDLRRRTPGLVATISTAPLTPMRERRMASPVHGTVSGGCRQTTAMKVDRVAGPGQISRSDKLDRESVIS
jgi:hypothetical protein